MIAAADKQDKQLPVTLLSGFLGSGKTTLLEHILRSKDHNLKCAVIVNDMASLNIDAEFIQSHQIVQKEEKVVQMQNGCICCTLRQDLLEEVSRLAEEGRYDYLIIESTGISEPIQVAETFTTDFADKVAEEMQGDDNQKEGLTSLLAKGGLARVARLDTCVTVIDCFNFFSTFETADLLIDRYENMDKEDERTISDLMIDQIEFANVILLNKVETVPEETLRSIEAIVRKLNPEAEIHSTSYSKIDVAKIVNRGLFNFEDASASAGWLKSLADLQKNSEGKVVNGKTETAEYGVSSFVYAARRPFDPKKLWALLDDKFFVMQETEDYQADGDWEEVSESEDGEEEEEDLDVSEEESKDQEMEVDHASIIAAKKASVFGPVLRSKGYVWLPTYPTHAVEWSQAGCMLTLSSGTSWFCFQPDETWPEDESIREAIRRDFDENALGDCRQELVFIGQNMDVDAIKKALDSCLISKADWKKWKAIMDKDQDWDVKNEKINDLFENPFDFNLEYALQEWEDEESQEDDEEAPEN